MSDNDFDAIQALWKRQPATPPEVDMTELQMKASHFSRKVRSRNISEWAAAAFVTAAFFYSAVAVDGHHPVTRMGSVLIAFGAVYIAFRIKRDGQLRQLPDATKDTGAYIEAYRGQLLAQAELLSNVPRWYLAPFVPGMSLFIIGFYLDDPTRWLVTTAVLAICLATFGAVALANRRAASRLTADARELDGAAD